MNTYKEAELTDKDKNLFMKRLKNMTKKGVLDCPAQKNGEFIIHSPNGSIDGVCVFCYNLMGYGDLKEVTEYCPPIDIDSFITEDRRCPIRKENYENIFQSMLKMADLEMERKRGNGECQKCYAIFLKEQIEQEFRVTNPITKETKLSILCKKCRKIIGLEMMENIRKRKEENDGTNREI